MSEEVHVWTPENIPRTSPHGRRESTQKSTRGKPFVDSKRRSNNPTVAVWTSRKDLRLPLRRLQTETLPTAEEDVCHVSYTTQHVRTYGKVMKCIANRLCVSKYIASGFQDGRDKKKEN